jgi:8-oxo-dGTP pyrophosphatase MutT (NUDIX family)
VGKDTQNQAVLITREFSSGGIVFKKNDGKVLWLVRKTAPSLLYPKTYWMLPKGRVDDTPDDKPGPMARGEVRADEKSLQSAAIREVEEETGVEANIIKKIGTIKYSFTDPVRGKIFKFVTYYLMEWNRDLPQGFDSETSEVAWQPFDKAYKILSFSNEKEALKEGEELLAPVAQRTE